MRKILQPGLVSIMMPAYNAEQFITQALESVLNQTYQNWELIIVNDGSTDHTPNLILKYDDPRIQIIHQSNGGESIARNTALRYMRGEFIAFLDADDVFLERHLELGVAYLKTHANCEGVYSDGYYIDTQGNRLQSLSDSRRGPFEGFIFGEVARASDVFGPPTCIILRQNLVNRFNLEFDPDIVIGPDWDFFTQFTELGCFGYITEHTCLYRVHQTNVTLRINLDKRRLSLARCREKTTKLDAFPQLADEIRTAVFYDLLVNLLVGYPQRQNEISKGVEFKNLPKLQQARLLRLMASKSILKGVNSSLINDWLRRSGELNPSDRRGAIVARLYHTHPILCRIFLNLRQKIRAEEDAPSPFGSLERK